MVRRFLVLIFLVSFLAIANYGCMKIGTYTHKRVDLEMRGNKGYVVGNSPSTVSGIQKPDRKVFELEITLPGSREKEETKQIKQEKQTQQPVYQSETKPKKSHPKIK